VSSGNQERHRLSRVGNRRINRTIHIMAINQLRHRTEGRAFYDRHRAGGMPSMSIPTIYMEKNRSDHRQRRPGNDRDARSAPMSAPIRG